jgi:hypothetical protein
VTRVGKLLTAETLAHLDECTVEGLPDGTPLLDVYPADSQIPEGFCQVSADCESPNLFCDTSSSSPFCSCAGGVDTCKPISPCKPTPCSVCNSCIQSLVSKFLPMNLYESRQTLAANFNDACPALLGASVEQCQNVAEMILYSLHHGNLGRRAGLLCQKLGICGTDSLQTSCELVINKPSTGTNVTGYLDLCRGCSRW